MVRKLFTTVGRRFRGVSSRARQSATKSISKARTTARRVGTISKRIVRTKKPDTAINATRRVSALFNRVRSSVAKPRTREPKRRLNLPVINLKDLIPKFKTPKIPKLFAGFAAIPALMNLKSKMPKFGFPKFKLPDVGGFFKQKTGDITDSLSDIFDSIKGKAGDFKEKRDRKKLIRKIVLAVIAIFIGMLIWKKVK